MKTSKTFQRAIEEQMNDTVIEQRHIANLDSYDQTVWRAALDGTITPAEMAEIATARGVCQESARKSLEQNRIVASLLSAEAGQLDISAAKTIKRLPALKLLPAREAAHEPEEDAAA
jgi:hypothetical protein